MFQMLFSWFSFLFSFNHKFTIRIILLVFFFLVFMLSTKKKKEIEEKLRPKIGRMIDFCIVCILCVILCLWRGAFYVPCINGAFLIFYNMYKFFLCFFFRVIVDLCHTFLSKILDCVVFSILLFLIQSFNWKYFSDFTMLFEFFTRSMKIMNLNWGKCMFFFCFTLSILSQFQKLAAFLIATWA